MRPADLLFPNFAAMRKNGLCPTCGKDIVFPGAFRDALSQQEYRISGMCQKCQDGVFNPAETSEFNDEVDVDVPSEHEIEVDVDAIDDEADWEVLP